MDDNQFERLMEALEPISLYYGGLVCEQVEREEAAEKLKAKKKKGNKK